MPEIRRNALIPYSPAQMYALVDDVVSYPQFLPWCVGAKEWSRSADEVWAAIALRSGALHKEFTTHNRLQRDKMIEMRLVEGPFSRLEGFWRFQALGEGACKVSLDLEYEFTSRLLKMAVGPVFNQIANTLVDAFCARAVEIYGKR